MSRPSLASLRLRILADFPQGNVDPADLAEFMEAFGPTFAPTVTDAADMVGVMVGTLPTAELCAEAEKVARIVAAGVGVAAGQTRLTGHSLVIEGQRWAISAFFDRLDHVSRASTEGGRA